MRVRPTERRHDLMELAGSQAGYFTAQQALGLDYSYQKQKYHVDVGNWLRVDRGIFRLRDWPVGRHEDLVRWTLWSKGRGAVSHETALSVYELGDVNPARIHLTVPPGFRRRRKELILHTGVLPDPDVRQQEGYSITTPLRTVLDVAAGNLDLDQLKTVVMDALDQGMLTRRQLLQRVDAFGTHAALRIERVLARPEDR